MPRITPQSSLPQLHADKAQLFDKSKLPNIDHGAIFVSKKGNLIHATKQKNSFLARFLLLRGREKIVFTHIAVLENTTSQTNIKKRHLLTSEQSRKVISHFLRSHIQETIESKKSSSNQINGKLFHARKAAHTYVDQLIAKPKGGTDKHIRGISLRVALDFVNFSTSSPDDYRRSSKKTLSQPPPKELHSIKEEPE